MRLFKKIAIIGGAGGLGSTMAFYLGLKEVAAQIALIDVRTNVLETHLVDLKEGLSQDSTTVFVGGDYRLLVGAELVIMAAASSFEAERPVSSRSDYLKKNLEIVVKSARAVRDRAPKALVILATAPTDVLTMVFHDFFEGDRHQLIGFCQNDSQRFRYALGEVLKTDPRTLTGQVLGEHGQTQVPIFSTVTKNQEKLLLTAAQKSAVASYLSDWYAHWQDQNSGRTTTWTSAVCLLRLLLALRGEVKDTPMGSVILDGEYGLTGVALGTPITPGPLGWSQVVETPLDINELKGLERSAQYIRALYAEARAEYPRYGKES
ncbi:MAG: hypothetical protein LBS60_00965 [Deltaproteobacteria bacterium]|jgi:malate/lactate dehydrogenase|nr:hypothetical protein [Deltaproteobacteria bacterium]